MYLCLNKTPCNIMDNECAVKKRKNYLHGDNTVPNIIWCPRFAHEKGAYYIILGVVLKWLLRTGKMRRACPTFNEGKQI